MPMPTNGVSGALSGIDSADSRKKFESLIDAASGLDSLLSHLIELQISIGVTVEVSEPESMVEEKPKQQEMTLVSMLNQLPDEMNKKVRVCHDLISVIMTELS